MPYNESTSAISSLNEEKKTSHGIFSRAIPIHRNRVARAESLQKPAENITVWDMLVPIAPNVNIPAQLYMPKNKTTKNCHTVFYIPGTAFVATESEFTHVICSHLCEQTQQQIIVIHPRLAPENQFPIGQNDCFLAFKAFIQSNIANIDINQITLAGYCSGGNFAIQMALLAQEEDIPIKHLLLISPFVDLSRAYNQYEGVQEQDLTISEEFAAWCAKMYVPSSKSNRDPTISPLWYSPAHFKKIAESIDIIVANRDRFFGDSMHLYNLLKLADVTVNCQLIEGDHSYAWHDRTLIDEMVKIIKEVVRIRGNNNQLVEPNALHTTLTPNQAPHSSLFGKFIPLNNENRPLDSQNILQTSKITSKL